MSEWVTESDCRQRIERGFEGDYQRIRSEYYHLTQTYVILGIPIRKATPEITKKLEQMTIELRDIFERANSLGLSHTCKKALTLRHRIKDVIWKT